MNKLQVTNKMSTETAKAFIFGKEVVYQYGYSEQSPQINVVNFQYQNPEKGNTVQGNVTSAGHINFNGMISDEDIKMIPEMLEIGRGILNNSKPKENPTLLDNPQKE